MRDEALLMLKGNVLVTESPTINPGGLRKLWDAMERLYRGVIVRGNGLIWGKVFSQLKTSRNS